MAIMPGALWKPVPSHSGQMSGQYGFAVHVQQGDNSLYGYFSDPSNAVSSHFWAAKDGTIEQYVDTANVAWAEMAGNSTYVSCETEGFETEALTPAQIASLAHIFAWGHAVHGWLLQTCDHGGQGLTTHCHYPSGVPDPAWGNHPCPGPIRLAQIPTVLNEAVTIASSQGSVTNGGNTVVAPPLRLKLGTPGVPPIGYTQLPLQFPPPTVNHDVYNWQYRMVQRGWELTVDGNYGPESEKICTAFQNRFKLEADGIVGPITWAATWEEEIIEETF